MKFFEETSSASERFRRIWLHGMGDAQRVGAL
jgi:hypothetical protein